MSTQRKAKNIEALDILFAIALGEGFLSSMYVFQERIIAGDIWTLGPDGQGMARVMIAFLVIVLSWLYYRNNMYRQPRYTSWEFISDLLVVLAYLTLFLLVESPPHFYGMLAVIWVLYAAANFFADRSALGLVAYILAFAGTFALMAVSVNWALGDAAEWSRILLTLTLVPLYRMLRKQLFIE